MLPPSLPTYEPTSYPTTNYFAALAETDEDDDTVVWSNRSEDKEQDDSTVTTEECTEDEYNSEEEGVCLERISIQQVTNDENSHHKDLDLTSPRKPVDTAVKVPELPQDTSNNVFPRPQNAVNNAPDNNNNAWQRIVQINNLHELPMADTIFNKPRVTKQVEYAYSDSGATAHFVVEGAPVTRKRIATKPLKIKLPDGSIIQSSHTCHLDIPWLPDKMTEAHIVPQLAHSSLISTRKFCDAGCKVVFDIDECRVYYNNKVVLRGYRDKTTELWKLPINPIEPPTTIKEEVERLNLVLPTKHEPSHAAYNVYTLPYKQNQLKYMHQSFFSPTLPTLLHAIENGQLQGIPFMKPDLIRKYLAKSPATSKGGMKRPRTGIQSTRETRRQRRTRMKKNAPETKPIPDPRDTHELNNVFCYAALADKQQGTLYTDATGALPVLSLDGHQYYFVAYDYDTNYIYAIPIKDVTDKTIIEAFDQVFTDLTERGYKPTFNVTDNQATRPLKEYLKKEDCKWQFVEPHNHRVNAAERAIQTFKNHFIRGLCSTDTDWPLQLWNTMTEQALITLNLLRTSRIDPTKSAYHQVMGHKYDWNAHPLAPPGTKSVVYESPQQRTSWGTRGVDAWYCGPAMDHYRNCIFYLPTTRSYRTSASFDLFPQHCLLPSFTPDEHAVEVHNELFDAVQVMSKPAKKKLLRTMRKALEKLTTEVPLQRVVPLQSSEGGQVVNSEGGPVETSEGGNITPPVDNTPHVTTSNNPTDPRVLQTMPRSHQRRTRRNIPGAVPAIINPLNPSDPPTRQSPRLNNNNNNTDDHPIITINELKPPSSSNLPRYSPHIISQDALNLVTALEAYQDPFTWTPTFLEHQTAYIPPDVDIEHFCAGVVHPVTGETITKYKKLKNDPATQEVWTTAFGKEFGNLAQGDNKTGEKGTNCIFVMPRHEIKNIPSDRTVTYGRIVVDYRPQKADPNRVRITAGGNLIDCPYDISTKTADLITSKVLWNSVLSTEGAKFMGIDIKSFYLTAPMDRYEYMKMPIDVFPQHTIEQYNLLDHVQNGFVYLECRRAIYGLPQAGALANKLLKERLAPAGYFEVPHTPGLYKHATRPIQFTLCVDDFGVKYVGKEHADHLIRTLKKEYTIEEDWDGDLYCGIKLDWNYEERHLDISMPRYIPKVLQRFEHKKTKVQNNPHPAQPRKFGIDAHDPLPEDKSAKLDGPRKQRVQQIVGSLLYYARAVDNTILVALNSLATEQANATEGTEKKIEQLLDYVANHPNATVRYHPSDMVLNIHSDASYLSESRARSRVGGIFFLGSVPVNGQPIPMNGAIHIFCGILKFVVASAAEAELGGLFANCKEGLIIRLILEEMGHKQPPTPLHCDNKTATGIANNTVKKQRSRTFEMRFFWVSDQVEQGFFDVQWHPGKENLADYFTKHFDGKHHAEVRPWYLYTPATPRFLPRAAAPSTLRGCVGTLESGYVRSAPLPRLVPKRHKTAAQRVHSIQRRPALSVGANAMLTRLLPMSTILSIH